MQYDVICASLQASCGSSHNFFAMPVAAEQRADLTRPFALSLDDDWAIPRSIGADRRRRTQYAPALDLDERDCALYVRTMKPDSLPLQHH